MSACAFSRPRFEGDFQLVVDHATACEWPVIATSTGVHTRPRWGRSEAMLDFIAQRQGLLVRLFLPVFETDLDDAEEVATRLNGLEGRWHWRTQWFSKYGGFVPVREVRVPNEAWRPLTVWVEAGAAWTALRRAEYLLQGSFPVARPGGH